jgi:hypothetical protein
MSSFSCSHFDTEIGWCLKLRTDCVPGRPGCVLRHNSVFAVPVEERIREKAEARQRKHDERQTKHIEQRHEM